MPTMLLFSAEEADAAESWRPAPMPDDVGGGTSGRARVLVAEDDPLVRAMLERSLVELGYLVCTARHGQEALDLALGSSEPFDLVITDVRMPRMSGPELGRRLEQRWPGIPVLYVSGYDVEPSADTTHRRHSFLKKPFDPDELALRVARLLGDA
ncbi:MAG TPA: response regulator [Gemmatimonadales bacterium]|nr:response regulator [Gemmatimonadales bacterium]